MPRSMRCTASSPQTCAMSVALLDHGEIVPGRGVTTRCEPRLGSGGAWSDSSRRSSVRCSVADSGRATSMKCWKCASRLLTRGSIERSAARVLSRRKRDRAGAPGSSSISDSNGTGATAGGAFYRKRAADPASAAAARIGQRRRNRHRELRDTRAVVGRDLADAALPDLVDAQHRVHRQPRALHAGELVLDALLRRVHDDRRALPEHEILDLDESKEATVGDLLCINLPDLALADKLDLENVTRSHLQLSPTR